MALKDILVHVDTAPTTATRLRFACEIASAHAAHVAALHVMAPPLIPAYVRAQLPDSVIELQDKLLLEDAAKVEAQAAAAGRAAGVGVEWRLVRGDLVESAMLQARHVDLTVVGQAGREASEEGPADDLPEALIMGAGRPVVIVPRYGSFSGRIDRILVAWRATREAARAVNDALPLLTRAARVTVLSINPTAAPEARIPGADISLHLARHGVTVEASTVRADDIDVGDLLLSRAADLGAQMIVMGAYGHSRLREMTLGGATRDLLRHMTVPVFMSH